MIQSPSTMHGSRGGKVEGNLNISNLPSKITENIPRNPPCKLKHPLEPPPLPEKKILDASLSKHTKPHHTIVLIS